MKGDRLHEVLARYPYRWRSHLRRLRELRDPAELEELDRRAAEITEALAARQGSPHSSSDQQWAQDEEE